MCIKDCGFICILAVDLQLTALRYVGLWDIISDII